jgi:hypothetical protein
MNDEINYKLIAEKLWGILDDISCGFDHYKPDMKDKFVYYVLKKCEERGEYAKSYDGQTLTFTKDIPVIEDLDPMTKWFKEAWKIEKGKPEPVVVPPISVK